MIALAFAFSYLESLIPFNFGIPGIKLGIANLVVIVALYTMNAKDALFISIIRILLSGLAFSGPFAMIYSLIGGLLSFLVMFAAKKSNKLSPIGLLGSSNSPASASRVAGITGTKSSIPYALFALFNKNMRPNNAS